MEYTVLDPQPHAFERGAEHTVNRRATLGFLPPSADERREVREVVNAAR